MQSRRQSIGVWVAAASDKGKRKRMAFGVLDVRNTRCIARRIHYDPGKVAQPYFTC